jgi:hypothetical protein
MNTAGTNQRHLSRDPTPRSELAAASPRPSAAPPQRARQQLPNDELRVLRPTIGRLPGALGRRDADAGLRSDAHTYVLMY